MAFKVLAPVCSSTSPVPPSYQLVRAVLARVLLV